jgi:hypothetical protein
MVDFNLNPASISELNKLGSVKAKRTTDYGFSPGAEDKDLVYNEKGCILLTGDRRSINENTYPPCNHAGIIILMAKRPPSETIVEHVRAFAQSGHRKQAKHNVVRLSEHRAIIHKHHNQTDEVQL